jgi:hypothetical protein
MSILYHIQTATNSSRCSWLDSAYLVRVWLSTSFHQLGDNMASFATILSDIGNGLKKFFTGAVKVAVVTEPIVDILFPGISSLYNLTVNAAANAENAAIAAGAQSGTGEQKLALVVASIENDFAAYAKAAGIAYSSDTITAWVNAVVATLNAIPSAPKAS